MESVVLNTNLRLEPATVSNLQKYLAVGIKSYCQHYTHLWKNNDPTPYVSHWFAEEVVKEELHDPNSLNYIINLDGEAIGILKLLVNSGIDEISDIDALKAEKIYLLQEQSGKGIGKQLLKFTEDMAKSLQKKVVWLDAMQKGNPIQFYQKNGYSIKRESEVVLHHVKPSEKAMWILTKHI
ncbi:GNAT family N-acetyltransferase [Allomuricauda sp. F6463D]|uniref:GNAT family N-acetyltransferase n=1 Tax=Allomuricauda sp. F6463D TaxID=2926409 RepID=UPI001FF3C8D9|nr:GNAT family N-acetyltransferase [Muricauda sp. F6463D]MCK0160303.1 GNAT family N-acetyltransferase [Muricauda sp. F6463D]